MKTISFSSLFDFQKKSKIKAGDGLPSGEYPLYTSSNIQSKYYDDYQFTGDSLIFGTGGNASIHFDEEKFAVSTDCLVAKPTAQDIYTKFVYYFLSGNIYILENGFKGAGLKHISKGYISDLKIPLPPLEQQKKIAAILDAADEYRQKTKALIAKYDELTQSLFLDMFGDPVTNPKGWEKVSTITFCDCIVPGRDKPKSFTGDTPWITTADLNHLGFTSKSRSGIGLSQNEISEVRARVIPKHSVIMTCVGDLGVVSINERDIVMNQQLHAFICHEQLHNVFLMHNLSYQTPYMLKMASSTTVPYMNKTVANNTPTIVPPIELQNQFAERVQAIETQKAQAQESLAKAEELFNSLLQKAFKGELV